MEDRRRGLFSYEALATRLAPNRFATDDRRDLSGPVIRLDSLTPEDCFVLLHNIRNVFASGDPQKYLIPDEGIEGYLKQCQERMGAAYFQTPRDTVKEFTGLLRVLEQSPNADWRTLLGHSSGTTGKKGETNRSEPLDGSRDELTEFRL